MPANGVQINVNHIKCPAGPDYKKRLYVLGKPFGAIAYCHHCGRAGTVVSATDGSSADRLRAYLQEKGLSGGSVSSTEIDRRYASFCGIENLSADGYKWLSKYLSPEEIEEVANIGRIRATTSGEVCLEAGAFGRSESGVRQIRRASGKPKYLTEIDKLTVGEKPVPYVPSPPHKFVAFVGSEYYPYVITEDILSSLKISLAGADAFPAMGSSFDFSRFTAEQLDMFKPRVPTPLVFVRCKLIVWADPDAAGDKLRNQVLTRAGFLGLNVGTVPLGTPEAKELSVDAITRIIHASL
jgi:hypothetical protein